MDIRYFGWSGVTIRHAGVLVGFDLFGDAVTWDALSEAAATILCATHGHPEHCGSLHRFLARPEAAARLAATHLISSEAVIESVMRDSKSAAARAHRLEAGGRVDIDGARVTAFRWTHMPLLPPGFFPKVAFAAHVLSRPFGFARVALSGLGLPLNAPMLGYHLEFTDGSAVLNYAEGLHRLTDPREVEAVARSLPADLLLFAVEPEDVECIPRWLDMLRPASVLLYEAHRPWRELFRLPHVDLDVYAEKLSARFPKTHCGALTFPGQAVRLPVGAQVDSTHKR